MIYRGLLLISCSTILLTGCPMPVSNMGNQSNYQRAQNYKLPYVPQNGKSVVYVTQGYEYLDAVIGAGTLSEGSRYGGSRVFVTPPTGKPHYIGTVKTTSLCFYASPGRYQIHFENKNANPPVFDIPLNITRQNIYFLALQHNDVTDNIILKHLSLSQGKFMINNTRPKNCLDLQSYTTTAKTSVQFNLKFINHTGQALAISPSNQRQGILNHEKSYTTHYNIDKDDARISLDTYLTNFQDQSQDIYSLSGFFSGLKDGSTKMTRVETMTAAYHSFWKTTLRSKTTCHSRFLSDNNIQLQCEVRFYRADRNEPIPYRETKTDAYTTVGESGVN